MKATHIYYNGTILTMDSRASIVSAMAVCHDKILAVGSDDAMHAYATADTNLIDLQGKFMMPGFYDAHSHFMRAGMYDKYYLNIFAHPIGNITNMAQLTKKVQEALATLPKGEWLLCCGYDDTALTEKRHFTLAELDAMAPDNPIYLRHISGHAALCNSLALQKAGITKSTPNPHGGVFCKNDQGELTGLLEEPAAMEMLLEAAPAMTEEKWIASIKHSSQIYLSQGVTTAHEGGTTDEMWKMYLKGHAQRASQVRVQLLPRSPGYAFEKATTSQVGTPLTDDNMLSLGAAKLFQDGSLQAYTGYVSTPYYKILNPDLDANWCGYPIYDKNTFIDTIIKHHKAGWQIAVHGNGDRGIDDILDAYEAAQKAYPRANARHIIIHCQMAREDQLDRIQRLGVIPSFFPVHTYYWGDRHRDIFLGPERAKRISPLKSALDRGIIFSTHCDTPVTPMKPLLSVWSSVNRLTSSGQVLGENQRISVIDALKTITIWAAYQHNEENIKGSLEPGKLADMVILDANPLEINKENINSIKVLTTIVGNTVCYGTI